MIGICTKFHLCVLPLQSYRSEEVNFKKVSEGNLQYVVVMETMYYACVPSFTSMRATVSKLEVR